MRILLGTFLLISVQPSAISSLDFDTDCACNPLRTIILEGQSVAVYKHAWYTIRYSSKIPLADKETIPVQALQLAQETRTHVQAQLKDRGTRPEYGTMLRYLALIALCGYVMSGSIAPHLYRLTLQDPSSIYFFPIARLMMRSKRLEKFSVPLATLQWIAGGTLAPVGILWACRQLYLGPADIRLLEKKIANLTDIIQYLETSQ